MNKLIEKANNAMLKLKCKAYCFAQSLGEDERGVSPIVATVLTILITVLLAVIFWDYIKTWIDGVWADITAEGGKINTSSTP